MKCSFTIIATQEVAGVRKYKLRCARCKLETAWTKNSDAAADCVAAEDDLTCPSRGAVVGTHPCEQCGKRGQVAEVYRCHHPENGPDAKCVLRKWTNRTDKLKAAGELVCFSCHLRPNALFNPDGTLRA